MSKNEEPHIKLQQHLASHGVVQKDFGNVVGVKQSIVSRLLSGKMRPSLDLAFRIEHATHGAVPAKLWAEEKGVSA